MATPYMNLNLPVVGPMGTLGPEWAELLNAVLEIVDSHDHSDGKGKSVTPAGLNINQALPFNNYPLTSVGYLSMFNNTAPLVGAGLIYESGGELYFNDGTGAVVQMTSGGTINVASLGTITGDYSTSTADLTYSDASKTFIFKQSATVTANVDCGPVKIYRNTAGSPYARIQQNNSQAGNLDWTLPVAYPGSNLPLKIDSSGVMTITQLSTADIADLQITASKLAADSVVTSKILDANVTTVKIADSNITTAKIADVNVTTAKIADLNVTTDKLADGAVTQAKRASLGLQQASLTSSPFTTTSTSAVDVTGLSVNITTTGRPVMIQLLGEPGFGGASGRIGVVNASTAAAITISVLRSGVDVGRHVFTVPTNSQTTFIPSSSFTHIDVPPAGTYTYKIQALVNSGSTTGTIGNTGIAVYEL